MRSVGTPRWQQRTNGRQGLCRPASAAWRADGCVARLAAASVVAQAVESRPRPMHRAHGCARHLRGRERAAHSTRAATLGRCLHQSLSFRISPSCSSRSVRLCTPREGSLHVRPKVASAPVVARPGVTRITLSKPSTVTKEVQRARGRIPRARSGVSGREPHAQLRGAQPQRSCRQRRSECPRIFKLWTCEAMLCLATARPRGSLRSARRDAASCTTCREHDAPCVVSLHTLASS